MNRPLRLRGRIAHKADDVAFKLEICMKATTVLGERVQTSPGNVTEKSLIAYIEAKKKLDRLMSRYEDAVCQVTDFLYANLEYEDADLLEWKYINGKSTPEIADEIGLAHQTVKNRISAAERVAKDKFGTNRY